MELEGTMLSEKSQTEKDKYRTTLLYVKVLVGQSCPTLCNPMNCSASGSSVHGILQARILEWVAIPFSRGSTWPRERTWVIPFIGRFFTSWATSVDSANWLFFLSEPTCDLRSFLYEAFKGAATNQSDKICFATLSVIQPSIFRGRNESLRQGCDNTGTCSK